jgi:chromosome segregation ATPase
VIQSILFFILGFLCAGFLALMVAPAIWRRAVALTRRRIEASVPLTLTEIQADKDRMRAEFAMSTRRLEMSVKSFRDKAAAQVVEINRGREELKRLAAERNDKNEGLTELETKASELRAELGRREEQLQRLSDKLADAEKALEQRALELDKLGRLYDDASFNSSSRQIELVARESEVEKLSGDVSALRDARKDAEQRYQEIVAEGRTTRDALKAEKRRAAELERKVDRLTSSLHDREETLDRREKELARLREKLKGGSVAEDELNRQVIEAQSEKVRLEAELASLTLQMSTLLSGAKGGDIEKAMEKLSADRDRLEDRLTALTRENRKLKDDIAAYERSKSEDWSDDRRESALLREQMNDLAAEVVKLTATLDGPDSPIARALAAPPIHGQPVNDPGEKVASLADRVRALQKAASAG